MRGVAGVGLGVAGFLGDVVEGKGCGGGVVEVGGGGETVMGGYQDLRVWLGEV